jgi:hypothetical protein
MNIHEGARRIQKVGRALLAFAAAALVFCIVIAVIARITTVDPGLAFAGFPLLLLLCLYPALLGTAFLVVGWIVEGFAMPPDYTSGD